MVLQHQGCATALKKQMMVTDLIGVLNAANPALWVKVKIPEQVQVLFWSLKLCLEKAEACLIGAIHGVLITGGRDIF